MQTKPKAILTCGLHRTSSDLKDLLHYFADEGITLLLPPNFYDRQKAAGFEQGQVKVAATKPENPDEPQIIEEYEQKIRQLDLSDSKAAEHEKLIKDLLLDRLPLSIQIIDGLETAKQHYDIRLLVIDNEAFIHERLMRDWCAKENIPTLHVNHGLILSTPGGAYWEFATDVLSTACPNEVDFLQEAFGWQKKPPRLEITGLPAWDKYALIQTPANQAAFFKRYNLQPSQKVVTFFPTIRNNTYLQLEKKQDPHLTGIQVFIDAVAQIAEKHQDTLFIIKDRPGNEKFMQDFVAIQAQKAKIPEPQLRYAFDYAEPYVAFSDITIATKSTIAGEAVLCKVPHINLIEEFGQALAFDPEINMAHVHTSELADYLDELLANPEKLLALRDAQQESDSLTGPARDFCSSMRVARLMAELMGEAQVIEQMDADMAAWQAYQKAYPNLSANDLLLDANNPLRFHWQNVASLLQFDHRFELEDTYISWLKRKMPLEVDGQLMAERLQHIWSHQPTFHLIFITDASLFSPLADSLSALDAQIYKQLGISIISTDPCPDESLLDLPHLQWIVNEHPFEQLNSVVDAVESDWVLLLQPGDELIPDALFNLADYANLNRDWLALYGDEDTKELMDDGNFRRKAPYFKPDFNLELLRASNYTGRLVSFRRDAIQALGGFSHLPYVQSEDLLLRLAERMTLPAIGHLPFITNHRNPLLEQVMLSDAVQACAQQVRQDHLIRCGFTKAQVSSGLKTGTWQISYPLEGQPCVALLLPLQEWHEGIQACINSLLNITEYPAFTLFVAVPAGLRKQLADHPDWQDSRLVLHDMAQKTSRFDAYHQLAAQASGFDYYCFLESDTHFVQKNWLERLVMHAQRPEVGMVAPRLVTPSARIFSAGQVLGMNGDVDDLFKDFHLEQDLGNMPRAWCDQNFSALNASCVLIKSDIFEKFGGFDPSFANHFYMTDLGLRMQHEGLRLHWTPYSTLACQGLIQRHKESQRKDERPAFLQRWSHLLTHDPAHNINLQLRDSGNEPDYQMATSWHPVYRQQFRVLLISLYATPEVQQQIATLGYLLSELQKKEKLRFGFNTCEIYAEEGQLPHLIEIARQDADLVIFLGEEKGLRTGLLKQLHQLTECAVGVYIQHHLESTAWQGQEAFLDLVISMDAQAQMDFHLPAIDSTWTAEQAAAFETQLHSCLLSIKKIKKN